MDAAGGVGLRASFAQGADNLLKPSRCPPSGTPGLTTSAQGSVTEPSRSTVQCRPSGMGTFQSPRCRPTYRAVVPKCAAMARAARSQPRPVVSTSMPKVWVFTGFPPFCPAASPARGGGPFFGRDTFITLRGRNSNPMKSTMFSGQNSSHSTKKGGRKTRFLISKNGVFARRPACGGFTFGENPTHPEAFHAAFGAPRRAPARPAPAGRPRSPRVRPAPAGRKAAPDAAPPDLGPVWAPRSRRRPARPRFRLAPAPPATRPVCARKRPFAARRPPAPPRRRGTPAGCARAAPFSPGARPRPARPAVPWPGCACAAPRLAPRPAAATAPAPGARRRPARRAAPGGLRILGSGS